MRYRQRMGEDSLLNRLDDLAAHYERAARKSDELVVIETLERDARTLREAAARIRRADRGARVLRWLGLSSPSPTDTRRAG